MTSTTKILAIGLLFQSSTSFAAKVDLTQYQLSHQKKEISVDGVMDEQQWKNATRIDLNFENKPGEGLPAPVKTEAYLYEDGENLYVAIKAYDPDPSKIRVSLRDRDSLWQDDNVGIIVDTFNDSRSGYEFFVNPLGAQADMRMSDLNGWDEDDSWDAIWDSAGKITDFGYVVEMSIPFNALRFPQTEGELTWNIAAWRNYPREVKVQTANVKLDRNIKCNLCQFDQLIGLKTIKPSKNFQVTPTLTLSRSDEKDDVPGEWQSGSVENAPGLDVRWGITQDMVLNATINPDFSQVESDAGQLDVNSTYSLFFPEKRPFFLDGASYFDTSRFNFVHTRNIADPDVGVKLTGKSSEHSYGLMVANDSDTSFLMPGNEGSDLATLDQKSEVMIGRYKMDVGERNNVGVLATVRNSDNYNNTLMSVDGNYWINETDNISYQFAHAQTDNTEYLQTEYDVDESQKGNALSINYKRETRNYNLRAGYTSVTEDFRADLGFQSRVDFQKLVIGGRRTWYGEEDDSLTQWGYFGDWDKTLDQDGNMIEQEFEIHGNIQGQMQFYSNFGIVTREKLYREQYFDETQAMAYAEFVPLSGVEFGVFTRLGKQIDYANTRLGDVVTIEPRVNWDVNQHLRVDFNHNYSQLDVDGGRLFTANLSDIRIAYQFNLKSILKFVVQYSDIKREKSLYIESDDLDLEDIDERSKNFSSQLIYSYKINPQTLFYLGYSDSGYQDDDLQKIQRDQRTLFTKFSYAWQL
ncbi:carbohydrate binding family 9 domain-containing protein [Pseudoalteromonas sp. C2R02]|uniref:carbohydrate binding family 9 domain-containing protein n=1 Tax=Pseudoalteromonas sp. C2R02 TaxID=2841565 RepID=UPI001C08F785|nr:carbohydrate binding family 9 domain-containing protein [Pseudoalteromonas sp. C2R02]MBU2968936.1 carbohydrate binding family 9 domain-containing protein [Pseudoalteromonas sp. C2R02]